VNGVLLDVVMVVLAVGKLKPDDEPPPPNKGADDVVAAIDADASGKPLGNENPLVVEAGNVNEAVVVVVGAVAFDGKPNKFGATDEVVVVDNDNGATGRVGALVPKENCGGLSDETVEETAVSVVVVASGVLPNDPNVIDVGILISDDDAVVAGVVTIEDAIGVLIAVVVFVDGAEPNDGNVEGVLVLI
jgi:hypothetical protein